MFFFWELFYTVASTESNDLKILMIMRNCKPIKVTYVEFAKQTIFVGKRVILPKSAAEMRWPLQNVSFLAAFSFDNFHFCGIRQSEYENREPVKQLFFFTYAGVQCTQEKNIIRWRYEFYWALLLVFCFY